MLRKGLYFGMTVIVCALTGCMVGPDFHSPLAPKTESYTNKSTPLPAKTVAAKGAGGETQYFVQAETIPAEWWTLFHSPEIDQLIRRGLKDSPNLAAAKATLRQAQENLSAQVGSSLLPAVSGSLAPSRERSSLSTIGDPGASSLFNVITGSLNVSYTFDVFGGARREIEGLRAQVDYERYELEAAYLTLTANIVTTAVNMASVEAQIKATQEMVTLQENNLGIVRKQVELGGQSEAYVLTQQTTLEQLRATLPPLEKSLLSYQNALAVLVGALPSEMELVKIDLNKIKLPTRLPVSLPSSLLEQRPDIRASEALLHQASAQIGVATANLLPQFTFSGVNGSTASNFGDLFKPNSAIWSLGANVSQPIFNGGSLVSQRKAAVAAYDVALSQYRLVVLQAFQNVADALHALDTDARTLKAQMIAEKSAKESYLITKQQYQLGGVSYISLLDTQVQYQQTVINRVQAQAARYADTAALFQALGGGWWNRTCLSACEKKRGASL